MFIRFASTTYKVCRI